MIPRLRSPSDLFGEYDVVVGSYLQGFYGGSVNYWDTSIRTGKSSNPIVLLRGTTPWRPPSSYRRFIRTYEIVSSKILKWGDTVWYSPPGNDPYGIDLMTRVDPYWGSRSVVYDENIKNQANTKALLQIAGNKAQLGVALLESKKAYQMIAKTTVSLWTAYRHAKRGEWAAVEKSLGLNGTGKVLSGRYPANKWLEYQYGWKPLLSDLFDAYGVVTGSLKSKAFLVHGKGSGKRSNSYKGSFYDSASGLNIQLVSDAEQVVITRLTGELTSERWRQAGQTGMINPLSIGWEVVPFSFLIDWFMPIGNVLEALTARAGLEFVGGSQTWLTGGKCVGTHINSGWPPIVKGGFSKMKLFDHTRAKLYTWPLALPYVVESPFNTSRAVNALALWRSTLRGRSPDNVPVYNTRRLRKQFRV